jgi:hypothetical protein
MPGFAPGIFVRRETFALDARLRVMEHSLCTTVIGAWFRLYKLNKHRSRGNRA